MNKFTKISLATSIVLASISTANADSLEEAFKASKVKGELKTMYFERESKDGSNSDITALGGNIGIVTGSYNGLFGGATFQTSHIESLNYSPSEIKDISFDTDMGAGGSIMSESYLGYKLGNTTLKAGRQFIATPIVSGSGSRMIRDSFEGYTLVNTDIPNTIVALGYVDKYAARTSSSFSATNVNTAITPGEFADYKDGASTVYIKNNSIANLDLQAQYLKIAKYETTGDATVAYADASYKMGDYKLSAQYLTSDNGKTSASDGTMMGAKIDAKFDNLELTAAYNTSDDKADTLLGAGEGATPAFTALSVGSGKNAAKKDTDSYMVKASYKLGDATLMAGYANYDIAGIKKTETELNAKYDINKQTSAQVVYSMFDADNIASTDKERETRVYLTYKF